jgi:hypothetical protein
MPTPQELAYTKAAQAVNSIIASGNQPDTATLANLAKAKKALATIGKDPTKAGSVATALTQNDEEAGEESSNALKKATRVAIDEFETGEHYAEIIDGVAEEYGVDPIELAKNIHSIGAIGDDELNEFIQYVNNTPDEASEICTGEPGCPCPACVKERKRRHDYIEDHGGDEDAESKPNQHAWSPSCDCPKCQAAYAKENERRRKTGLSHESVNIGNFLKAVSQKNYAQANKYLQAVVDGKLKRSISNAANK